MKLAAKSQIFH